MEKFTTMTKARLIHELNELLQRDYALSPAASSTARLRARPLLGIAPVSF
jgi:hypothetical protein